MTHKKSCKENVLPAGDAGTQFELPLENTQWKAPIPFSSGLLPVKQFDENLLPKCVRAYAMHHAKRMDNTPPDFSAISIIVCAGALVGGNVEIQPKEQDTSWTVVPTMWGAAVGTPSTKKTPSLNCGMSLLRHVQDKILDPENNSQKAAFEINKEIIDEKIKDIKAKAKFELINGNTDYATELLNDMPSNKHEDPIIRDIIINDCTSEALAIRLKSNPSGVLVFRDELTAFLASMKQSNREHERGFYLEGFNGSKSPYIQERVSRERVEIKRVVISLLGGIQPQMLIPLLSSRDTGASDDGMVERIIQLMVYPDHNNAIYIDEKPSSELQRRAELVFEKLAQLNSPSDPTLLKFDKHAQELWNNWSIVMLEKENNAASDWQSLFGKYKALCAKLALIIHLLNDADNCNAIAFTPHTNIEINSLQLAIKWIDYLETHAKRIITMGKTEENNIPAYALLNNLYKFSDSFTKHQLSQKDWRGLKTAEQRNIAIETLIQHNYIVEITNPKKMYLINPMYI